MNEEDRRIEACEREASPERFPSHEDKTGHLEKEEGREERLSRTVTGASTSSSGSSSSGESVRREEIGVSRIPTQLDLERHPTALSRIQTAKSQHSATVGAATRSRTATRNSRLPLPAFGAGKEYPPPLPDREEYVVEFDGPDDVL